MTSPGRDRSWPRAYLGAELIYLMEHHAAASPSPSLCPPDPSPTARFGSTACFILGRVRVVSAAQLGCALPGRAPAAASASGSATVGFGCVVSSAHATVSGSQVALRFRGSGGRGADGGLPASRPPHLQAGWPRCEGDAKSRVRSRGSLSCLATLGLSCRQLARVGGGFISPPPGLRFDVAGPTDAGLSVSRLRRGRGDCAGLRRAGDAWPSLRVSGRRPSSPSSTLRGGYSEASRNTREGSGRASRAWPTVMRMGHCRVRDRLLRRALSARRMGLPAPRREAGRPEALPDRSRPLKKPYESTLRRAGTHGQPQSTCAVGGRVV